MTLLFPLIENVAVLPLTSDEWYGIEVRFGWVPGFDYTRYRAGHSGVHADRAERDLKSLVEHEVRASDSYTKFDGNRPMVEVRATVEGGGPLVARRIPKLDTLRFDDWRFGSLGGSLIATTRE